MATQNPELSASQGKKAIRSLRAEAGGARGHQGPQHHPDDGHDDHHPGVPAQVVRRRRTSTITFDANLQVPKSSTQLKPKQAVAVTVTKKVILVEGEPVAPINGGKVDPAVKRDGENGYYITPLVDMLEKQRQREKKVAEMTGQKFEAQLMIVADQTTPYRLLTEDHLFVRPGRVTPTTDCSSSRPSATRPRSARRAIRSCPRSSHRAGVWCSRTARASAVQLVLGVR